MKYSVRRAASPTRRDTAKRNARTVFTSVVCLVRAGAGAVAHVVVHQALVDGAPRCATVVRTNERIRDHPGSQAALAEELVQSWGPWRSHRHGRKVGIQTMRSRYRRP